MENELILKGNIIAILPTVVTEKNGKTYHNRTFVIENKSPNSEYVNLYAFDLFGVDKVSLIDKFAKEQEVSVSYNVPNSRLYNGKWYTNNPRAWKIKAESEAPADFSQPTTQSTTQASQTTAQPESLNDKILKIVGSLPETFAKKVLEFLKLTNEQAEIELLELQKKAQSEAGKQKIKDLIELVNQRPEKPTEPDDLPF